ncbi:16S rRNA (guanine(527)-N(7))-methyltransferase RsmG [Pseudoflavonifractor phocaeensis]|uniref:16S rRNA (guanine(527)-N(7))-methyltransferase RsmG n=1 Tax=Pseudoflavonifractor phocaeensis TaxID=1870988 RepID=UPI00195C794D|nr:16S rRNA (guanine(527)-N(7))-methyltransferase RsmG [Pseudoflavonifractor phocaeensis]MBM6871129.1 16S rRNA (guanine(527)-N(7))-methyltransferase RsmG [Pseudoflavonifractor phocaeensis]
MTFDLTPQIPRIRRGLDALGVSSPQNGPALLAQYGALLLEQNQVMNLTAITDPDQVTDLHFLDSAALLACTDFSTKTVIDVGTGAGFPGVPLRILEPSLSLTLLDSLGKRVHWLESVCETLGLDGVTCLHARAEEQALRPGFRDGFDIAVSRAVASLEVLTELCLPYVKVGGLFLAMKSVDAREELDRAGRCVSKLGGQLLPAWDYAIPGAGVTHRLIPIRKVSPTPKGFPRRWAKIQKSPLV